MKKIINIKTVLFYPIILLWQLFLLPLKSFALSTITYQPLEANLYSGVGGQAIGTGQQQFGQFLTQAFSFGLALAAALAVIMVVWGGVEIMLSESVFKKEDGKKKIQDAIWGLLLALGSYLILYTINPEILNFKL